MNLNRILRKKDDIVTRTIGGEVFLVPIHTHLKESQKLYALNPVAEYIWSNLDGRQRLVDIKGALVEEFDVGPDQLHQDMALFIQHLEQENLISETGGDPAK